MPRPRKKIVKKRRGLSAAEFRRLEIMQAERVTDYKIRREAFEKRFKKEYLKMAERFSNSLPEKIRVHIKYFFTVEAFIKRIPIPELIETQKFLSLPENKKERKLALNFFKLAFAVHFDPSIREEAKHALESIRRIQ